MHPWHYFLEKNCSCLTLNFLPEFLFVWKSIFSSRVMHVTHPRNVSVAFTAEKLIGKIPRYEKKNIINYWRNTFTSNTLIFPLIVFWNQIYNILLVVLLGLGDNLPILSNFYQKIIKISAKKYCRKLFSYSIFWERTFFSKWWISVKSNFSSHQFIV